MLTRDRTVLLATLSGMSRTCLYSPAAERQRILAGTHSRATEGKRLSWPRWLGKLLRWFACLADGRKYRYACAVAAYTMRSIVSVTAAAE